MSHPVVQYWVATLPGECESGRLLRSAGGSRSATCTARVGVSGCGSCLARTSGGSALAACTCVWGSVRGLSCAVGLGCQYTLVCESVQVGSFKVRDLFALPFCRVPSGGHRLRIYGRGDFPFQPSCAKVLGHHSALEEGEFGRFAEVWRPARECGKKRLESSGVAGLRHLSPCSTGLSLCQAV